MTQPANLDLDAVLAFAAFADSLNFSEAARGLHISQPALHVKVRKLSERLDRPLYRRVGRALELTEHGELVARYGRQLREGTSELLAQLHGMAERPVTLAAGEGAYLYLLKAGITHFQKDASAPLRLLTLNRDEALAAVLGGKAQLGVAPLDVVPEQLQSIVLTTVGQVLAVPEGHRLARRSRLRLKDLAGERLVVPPRGRPHREMLAALLQSAEVLWEVALEANGWELMLSFVAMGAGSAVVNACCSMPPGVVAIPIPELPTLRYHCFHLRGLLKSTPAERLRVSLQDNGNAWKASV
jgi:LysR family transcriptional regulator, low CO2-responsive transcriptional regulator